MYEGSVLTGKICRRFFPSESWVNPTHSHQKNLDASMNRVSESPQVTNSFQSFSQSICGSPHLPSIWRVWGESNLGREKPDNAINTIGRSCFDLQRSAA